MSDLRITSIAFTTASAAHVQTGLIGWINFVLNDTLLVDGVTLRRTVDGKLTLSFPERRDTRGRKHSILRPVDDDARRDIERQIFDQLCIEQGVAP